MAQLVARPHWISDRGEVRFGADAGQRLGDVLPMEIIEEAKRKGAVCQINGERVEAWEQYQIQKEDVVTLSVYPQGGGDNKSLMSMVVMVAVMVAVGPAGYALTAGQQVAVSVGASLVLGLINKALIKPPPQPNTNTASSNPFYQLSGGNQMTPWGSVPRLYGRMRMNPINAQQPLTMRHGQDQYLYQIFDFGYGPLQLIAGSDRVGETPISTYDKGNLGAYFFHSNFTPGSALKVSNNKTVTRPVGATLRKGNSRQEDVPSGNSSVRFDFQIPRGLTNTDYQEGEQETYIQFKLERAVVVGINNWLPLESVGTVKFTDNSIVTRRLAINKVFFATWRKTIGYGSNRITTHGVYCDPVPGGGYTNIQLRLPKRYNGINAKFDLVRYSPRATFVGRIRPLPENQRQRATHIFIPDDPRQIPQQPLGWELYIYSRFQDDGVYWVYANSRTGLALGAEYAPTNANLAMRIKITRVNDDAWPAAYHASEFVWSTIEYQSKDDFVLKAEVPHTVAELKIKATDQLQGTIDNYSAIVESILPYWDGSNKPYSQWPTKATRNPAWAFCNILMGSANRRPITPQQMDLPTIKSWADECDANYKGAPRYFCDMVFSGATTVKEALSAVASIGRASPTIRDGKISVIRESVTPLPVQLITPKNSKDFSGSMVYRPTAPGVKITYADEQEDYQVTEERIDNPLATVSGNYAEYETIDLPGITRRSQAIRAARYFLAEAELRRERATVTMDIENLVAQRGDIVLVAHDVLDVGGAPLKVMAVNGNAITVDESLPSLANAVRLRGQNTVQSVTQTDADTFTIAAGHGIRVGDVLEYGVSNSIKADYIVESVQPAADLSATLSLVEYRPEVLQAEDGNIPTRVPKPGVDTNGYRVGPPQAVQLLMSRYLEDRHYYTDVSVTWAKPASGWATKYHAYDLSGTDPILLGETDKYIWKLGTVPLVGLNAPKEFRVGIVALNAADFESMRADTHGSVQPDKSPPSDVRNLGSNILTTTIHLFWDLVTDEDLSHYEIRYSPDLAMSVNWSDSTLVTRDIAYDTNEATVPARTGTYLIKAVDTGRNYSVNPAVTVTHVNELPQLDLMYEYVFNPFDPTEGEFQDTEVVNGNLTLIDGVDEGWWFPDEQVNFGSDPWTMRLMAKLKMISYAPDEHLDQPYFDPLEDAVPLSPSSQGAENKVDAQIYYLRQGDLSDEMLDQPWFDPLENAVPISPSMGSGHDHWQRLIAADVNAANVRFAIKLTTTDPDVRPRVISASVLADWHERSEKGTDVAVSTTGKNITFQNPFAPITAPITKPTVTVSLQNANPGDTVVLEPHDTLTANRGFKVRILSAGGTATTGTVDWAAIGVGKGY